MAESTAEVTKGAVVVSILFSLKDEVKSGMNEEALQKHLGHLVDEYKKVPGLLAKTFFTNPENLDQGAFLVFSSRAAWDEYLTTPLYKEAVLDVCKGEPRIEVYAVTASLKDGVLV